MLKYLLFISLFFTQILLANWDKYEGEKLVLFSLAPGTGDQFTKSCEEQKLPTYFRKIAREHPDIKAKIIAIDPRLSQDHTSSEYAFLTGWENDGITFKKDNIEIQFFSEYIPDINVEYTKRLKNYLLKVLENGGAVFIGHHTNAYYAFEPFREVYNEFNSDNMQMYICCADYPPFSTPKVYGNHSCSNEELDAFFEIILPHIHQFFSLADEQNKEACHQLLDSITQKVNTSFIFYRDMLDLPYDVIRTSDGSVRIINVKESAKAA